MSKKERGPHDKGAWKEKDIDPASLAGRARAARKATGLTTRKFGALVPVSHATISDIENAKTDPAVTTVQAILTTLREILGDKKFSEYFPLTLDLEGLESRGKITEQVIDYPLPPAADGKLEPVATIHITAKSQGWSEGLLNVQLAYDALGSCVTLLESNGAVPIPQVKETKQFVKLALKFLDRNSESQTYDDVQLKIVSSNLISPSASQTDEPRVDSTYSKGHGPLKQPRSRRSTKKKGR